QESIYVGDSPSDILAGKRAGVMTGAALWGGSQTRKDPTREHPDYEFRTVGELSDLLLPKGKRAKHLPFSD
ncbi:MAG TPA: hypothetical protein VFE96_01405, partial [Candidatus Bathyarchaeia archaeon]|nr:hypothetical protein [Candidatus Bathyarchaeia archaeon]